jgi:hypothetical protein
MNPMPWKDGTAVSDLQSQFNDTLLDRLLPTSLPEMSKLLGQVLEQRKRDSLARETADIEYRGAHLVASFRTEDSAGNCLGLTHVVVQEDVGGCRLKAWADFDSVSSYGNALGQAGLLVFQIISVAEDKEQAQRWLHCLAKQEVELSTGKTLDSPHAAFVTPLRNTITSDLESSSNLEMVRTDDDRPAWFPSGDQTREKWREAYTWIEGLDWERRAEYEYSGEDPQPTLEAYALHLGKEMQWKPSEKTVSRIRIAGSKGWLDESSP